VLLLLIELLLLDRRLQLVLVFEGLALHLLLTCQALLVGLSALLPHLLLLLKLLAVALKLQLHLVLGLTLLHLLLILNSLTLLLFLHLRFLDR